MQSDAKNKKHRLDRLAEAAGSGGYGGWESNLQVQEEIAFEEISEGQVDAKYTRSVQKSSIHEDKRKFRDMIKETRGL